MGTEEKSLRSDPGSELRLEKEREKKGGDERVGLFVDRRKGSFGALYFCFWSVEM